jgi:hypothetical protein
MMNIGLVELAIILVILLLLAVVIGGAVMAAVILFARRNATAESTPSTQGRAPCPYCAELILPEAKVCRYCGRELPVDFQQQRIEP